MKQYQPFLGNAKTSAEIARRATEVKNWVKSVDNSRSDSNETDNIIDHIQFGMGYRVQADVVDLGFGGFEVDRMLERKDALPLASHVQCLGGQIQGYEVNEYPDGSKQGFSFVGPDQGHTLVRTSLLEGQDAQIAWSKVFVKTVPLPPVGESSRRQV